jgi:hypothetical protein
MQVRMTAFAMYLAALWLFSDGTEAQTRLRRELSGEAANRADGIAQHVGRLAQANEALITEIKATDRFKRALQRFAPLST